MRTRRRYAGIFIVAACPWRAEPALAGSVPYNRLVAAQVMFETIPVPQRDKIRVRVVITHSDATNHAPIHLWVNDHGTRTDLPIGADGLLDLELRRDWIAEDIIVQSDQPDKSLQADVAIGIRMPASPAIPVRYLREAASQAQAVIDAGTRQMAGFLAFFVTPNVKGVQIKLARCCAERGTLAGAGKRQNLPQDGAGELNMTMSVLQSFDGGMLTTTAPVSSIDPWVNR